jgi:oligoribonuclease
MGSYQILHQSQSYGYREFEKRSPEIFAEVKAYGKSLFGQSSIAKRVIKQIKKNIFLPLAGFFRNYYYHFLTPMRIDPVIGIFLDTETNGLNPKIHKILEIAYKIVDLENGELKEEYQTVIANPIEAWEKSDQESLRINGFTWDEVSKGKTPRQVSQQIIDSFTRLGIRRKKAVFICQNPSFDRVFFSQLIDPDTQELLQWPYHWLDLASMYWALSLVKAKESKGPFPWETGLSKDTIAAQYKLASEAKPHRAMNGASHLLLCYEAIVGFPSRTCVKI